MVKPSLQLLGYAFGDAGADPQAAEGPSVIKRSSYLRQDIVVFNWNALIKSPPQLSSPKDLTGLLAATQSVCENLSQHVLDLIKRKKYFAVVGGDHTSAIGTWSGVHKAVHAQGEVGLIWVDAHMDAHTPDTTESGRIHGMPLAVLLGQGYPMLVNVAGAHQKLKPENICLVGVRSYESGEADFLKKNNVRIFYIEEIQTRGFDAVIKDAIEHVTQHTVGFGLSLDLDSIDPIDAPAVAVPEANGIAAKDILSVLPTIVTNPKYITTEIVEFDPPRDIERKTEKLIAQILETIGKNARPIK